jgi:hypothetical protein
MTGGTVQNLMLEWRCHRLKKLTNGKNANARLSFVQRSGIPASAWMLMPSYSGLNLIM